MAQNSQKDPSQYALNLPTADNSFESLVRFYRDGTDEVKSLLKDECNLIYECR
jgi:hypothetical protein